MNKLRSDDLSVIVRIQHGIGFELTEGSVTVEATFDGDLRQGLHTFPALRNRVNFDERFVWLADRTTVKNMRLENRVVLVECFRIPTVPADRSAYVDDELYERQRVGQAVIRLKDFQVIGRDWDQEVMPRSYKLHCGTGNGNVALRMTLIIKDTTAPTAAAAAVFNKLPAAKQKARHRRPQERSVTTDRHQPVTSNRLQPVAIDRPRLNVPNRQLPEVTNRPRPDITNRPQPVTAKNRQSAAKTITKRELYKKAKTPVTAYQSTRDRNFDDNTNSMRAYENVNLMRIRDNSNSMHLHKSTCPHNTIGLGASSAATDDFIKTMEHLTVDMGEVRKKTSRQCEAVNDYANMSGLNVTETNYKKASRMCGGKGGINRLDPSEKHQGGNITAATSNESLLDMTTASVLSDDAVTCVRRIRKCNNAMSNVMRDEKTSGTAADLSSSSQSDYDMQHPIMLVEELQKSVNQFADCFYRTRKKRYCTKAKYSRGMTVLKKLDVETIKINDKIRDVWQAACNQCYKPLRRPI